MATLYIGGLIAASHNFLFAGAIDLVVIVGIMDAGISSLVSLRSHAIAENSEAAAPESKGSRKIAYNDTSINNRILIVSWEQPIFEYFVRASSSAVLN